MPPSRCQAPPLHSQHWRFHSPQRPSPDSSFACITSLSSCVIRSLSTVFTRASTFFAPRAGTLRALFRRDGNEARSISSRCASVRFRSVRQDAPYQYPSGGLRPYDEGQVQAVVLGTGGGREWPIPLRCKRQQCPLAGSAKTSFILSVERLGRHHCAAASDIQATCVSLRFFQGRSGRPQTLNAQSRREVVRTTESRSLRQETTPCTARNVSTTL